jgi:ribosomal protein S27AE
VITTQEQYEERGNDINNNNNSRNNTPTLIQTASFHRDLSAPAGSFPPYLKHMAMLEKPTQWPQKAYGWLPETMFLPHPSSFFYIGGGFYDDRRSPLSISLSSPIIHHSIQHHPTYDVHSLPVINSNGEDMSEKSTVGLGQQRHLNDGMGIFTQHRQEDTLLGQIPLRIGEQYLFQHQGNCQHVVMFTEMRIKSIEDYNDKRLYPLVIFRSDPNHLHRSRHLNLFTRHGVLRHIPINRDSSYVSRQYDLDSGNVVQHYPTSNGLEGWGGPDGLDPIDTNGHITTSSSSTSTTSINPLSTSSSHTPIPVDRSILTNPKEKKNMGLADMYHGAGYEKTKQNTITHDPLIESLTQCASCDRGASKLIYGNKLCPMNPTPLCEQCEAMVVHADEHERGYCGRGGVVLPALASTHADLITTIRSSLPLPSGLKTIQLPSDFNYEAAEILKPSSAASKSVVKGLVNRVKTIALDAKRLQKSILAQFYNKIRLDRIAVEVLASDKAKAMLWTRWHQKVGGNGDGNYLNGMGAGGGAGGGGNNGSKGQSISQRLKGIANKDQVKDPIEDHYDVETISLEEQIKVVGREQERALKGVGEQDQFNALSQMVTQIKQSTLPIGQKYSIVGRQMNELERKAKAGNGMGDGDDDDNQEPSPLYSTTSFIPYQPDLTALIRTHPDEVLYHDYQYEYANYLLQLQNQHEQNHQNESGQDPITPPPPNMNFHSNLPHFFSSLQPQPHHGQCPQQTWVNPNPATTTKAKFNLPHAISHISDTLVRNPNGYGDPVLRPGNYRAVTEMTLAMSQYEEQNNASGSGNCMGDEGQQQSWALQSSSSITANPIYPLLPIATPTPASLITPTSTPTTTIPTQYQHTTKQLFPLTTTIQTKLPTKILTVKLKRKIKYVETIQRDLERDLPPLGGNSGQQQQQQKQPDSSVMNQNQTQNVENFNQNVKLAEVRDEFWQRYDLVHDYLVGCVGVGVDAAGEGGDNNDGADGA